jgi:hypothetical protein
MRHPMSLHSRRELLAGASKRYAKSNRAQRKTILDEFVLSTGYERNYAIALLLHPPLLPAAKRGRRPRSKTYGPALCKVLEQLWVVAGCICGKRLAPMLRDLIVAMERHNEIVITDAIRARLLTISAATCDRLLGKARAAHPVRGLCTTKPTPHLLLRSQIPVRTFSDWNEERPGFMEVDLVAHCGETTKGNYINTLTAVDVQTGWTRCLPLPNKSMIGITQAMDTLRRRLPFSLLGIDTDNGGEFINHNLVSYCETEFITMTRCRPYKKNDQCHVEQKNGNIVRAMAGYARYESPEAMAALERLYGLLDDYQNYFQPSAKLLAKHREGAKVTKTYDTPKTPYQRLIESDSPLRSEDKQRLEARYRALNPAALQRRIVALRQLLRKLADGYDPHLEAAIEGLAAPHREAPGDRATEGPATQTESSDGQKGTL